MENFNSLQNICVSVFQNVAGSISVFIVPLFLMKIVFHNIIGEGHKSFEILKGTIIYFCLVLAFPMILEILFSIPESFLPKLSNITSFTSTEQEWSGVNLIPFAIDRLFEALLAVLYWVSYYLHIFFMMIMCSMAPIIFLTSTLLGLGIGIEIFLGLLIISSSWPLIWYGFDQIHLELVKSQSDEFAKMCLELLITLLKGLAPVSFAALAVKSPAGRAITQTARFASGAVQRYAMKGNKK